MTKRYAASNGKYYTRQLFWEEWTDIQIDCRMIDPPFTLHKDKEGLINFGKRYVESCDPTGYKVAKELLGDYNHWTALMSCRWFVAAKEIWDREMDAMLSSEAVEKIRELMVSGLPAQQLAAAKYLAGHEYRKNKITNKGRPKREDIDRAAQELAVSERDLQMDLKRITEARG